MSLSTSRHIVHHHFTVLPMPQDVIDGLRAFGHEVAVMPADSLDFGSAQAVARLDPANHRKGYVAGSDHRRDGMAVGF